MLNEKALMSVRDPEKAALATAVFVSEPTIESHETNSRKSGGFLRQLSTLCLVVLVICALAVSFGSVSRFFVKAVNEVELEFVLDNSDSESVANTKYYRYGDEDEQEEDDDKWEIDRALLVPEWDEGAESESGDGVVTISTSYGKVRGVEMTSRQGRKYYAFLKVPFARPPTGKLRFKSPKAVLPWIRTLDATIPPPECIQKVKYSDIVETAGAEDCLYMSIYTPILRSDDQNGDENLLPVMFYIHGGGFSDGNGTRYGAKYFMDEDVVLITFQYRLGPFGYLNTEDGDIRGNMGFKDQVEAMRFVQRIIKDFNGDRKRVTIFGNSAGGFSVGYHLVSPLSKGLFSRAIAQSGTAVSVGGGMVDKNPSKTAALVAERFNCSYGQEKLSDCLRDKDASEIALVRQGATYQLSLELQSRGAFMVDYPLNLLKQGKVNRVPWITGFNSGEGLQESIMLLKIPVLIKLLNGFWNKLAPLFFLFNSSAINPNLMSQRAHQLFFGDKLVSNDTVDNLTAICTDRFMGHSTKTHAYYHAKKSPVYLYYLTKKPAKSYADKYLKGFPPGYYGVAHADELQFLLLYNGYPEYNTTSEYFSFSRALVKRWTTFGANGSPGDDWLAYEEGVQENWFNLDDESKMTDVLQERMTFWDSHSTKELYYE